jgi:hypothetical protein
MSERQRNTLARFVEMGRIREYPETPWEEAFVYRSAYYDVTTNTSQEVARYIGILMDAQVVALTKIFRFRMQLRRRKIWAFRTRAGFERHGGQLIRGRIGPQTGGFWTTAGGGTIVLPYTMQRSLEPGEVLLHEASHQFLHAALEVHRIPMWLDEGLAVFFETSRYNPLTRRLEIGLVPRERLLALQQLMKEDRHPRLAPLLETGRRGFGGAHYAASWSFLYWLIRSAESKEALRRQKVLNAYLFDIKARRSDPARLFTYLGKTVEEVEGEWKQWVLQLDPDDPRGGTSLPGD